ncbi:DGAT2 [Symbiodinium sp. CCMP2456]|nr:DGAT2 [Symbiodinium sp. CCMP2456]
MVWVKRQMDQPRLHCPSIRADKASISRALKNGDSVGLFPGGIAEMVRTDANTERLLLNSRKGVVKIAMEHKVPLVPVYVFGQSVLWSRSLGPQLYQPQDSKPQLRIPGAPEISKGEPVG